MGTPPRDALGRVQPHDDPDIPNDAYLVRYIDVVQMVSDGQGGKRLSSGAFSSSSKRVDHYQSMSCDFLNEMQQDSVQPSDRLKPTHAGAVRIRAGDLRAMGLKVGPDPRPGNPYHVGVWGISTKKQKRDIRARSEWIEGCEPSTRLQS